MVQQCQRDQEEPRQGSHRDGRHLGHLHRESLEAIIFGGGRADPGGLFHSHATGLDKEVLSPI